MLRQKILRQAARLGFVYLGVTTCDPPPNWDVYERWLADGKHGEMAYLATERARVRRADPRRILPDCRSILSLGIPYPPAKPVGLPTGDRLIGRVASYAWGEDYHNVLPERMRSLLTYIEAQVGRQVSSRWYTDTGPVLERDLAQRAGLGWIGKNTCLIHPQKGSYFFLAQILIDLDLPPDSPFSADRCGSCTRCIEACPTGCILPDRTIDSRRCISYLTIELKSAIPNHLRAQMGDWVFGCDICQQVCPWNQRFANTQVEPAYEPREGLAYPDLTNEISLTPVAFNRKFKGSPVKRAKRRGYLRNVAVALGNHGDEIAISSLSDALLTDPEPLVRGHSAWALGSIGGVGAHRALTAAIEHEPDLYVHKEIESALDTIV